ncbi:MAG: hypothetical protein M3Q56_07800 [Bacteroidota bacterium]|nr:hypothetical protein [Bacteroidota bacterium]
MKTRNFFLLLLPFLTSSCLTNPKENDFKKMEWLIGTWKGETSGQPFYETWSKVSEKEFSNINFSVCNGDTIVGSRSKIALINNKIAYTSHNNIRELTSLSNNECIFEDKQRSEKFTFTLNEKKEWLALLKYPTSQIEYNLTKTIPIADLLKNKQTPIEGHYEGYIEFNNKKLNTTIDFSVLKKNK